MEKSLSGIQYKSFWAVLCKYIHTHTPSNTLTHIHASKHTIFALQQRKICGAFGICNCLAQLDQLLRLAAYWHATSSAAAPTLHRLWLESTACCYNVAAKATWWCFAKRSQQLFLGQFHLAADAFTFVCSFVFVFVIFFFYFGAVSRSPLHQFIINGWLCSRSIEPAPCGSLFLFFLKG